MTQELALRDDEVIEGEIVGDDDADGDWMENEVVLESAGDGHREYVELGVDQGEQYADMYVEGVDDGGEVVGSHLMLDADQIRDLIASLETALETVEANS